MLPLKHTAHFGDIHVIHYQIDSFITIMGFLKCSKDVMHSSINNIDNNAKQKILQVGC